MQRPPAPVRTRKKRLDRLLEIAFDDRARLFDRKGRQSVLQERKIAGDRLAQKIGARGERLSELDKGGAHFLQRAGEPFTGSTRGALIDEPFGELDEGYELRDEGEGKERIVARQRAGAGKQAGEVAHSAQHARSQAPSGMDRGDPAGEVANAYLLEPRRLDKRCERSLIRKRRILSAR